MSRRNEILKCNVCGLTAEVLQGCSCAGEPLCCGKPMQVMPEQSRDYRTEKHVPWPVQNGETLSVKVGNSVLHPMSAEHHIEWIEVLDGDSVYRKYLKPGDVPEAEFPLKLKTGMRLREFCNLHGLWEFEVK